MRLMSLLCPLLLALASPLAQAALRLPAAETFTLNNGAHVILVQKKDVPLVAARVAIRGGAQADAPGKEGSANLLAQLLGKGAAKRDAIAFADAISSVGGQLSLSADHDAIWISADFLAEDSALMLELLSDALLHPALSQQEFEKLRTRSIQSISAAKDGDPRSLMSVYGNAWLFQGHSYGRPVDGDERSLAALSIDDMRNYYKQHVGADRAIIAIAGDIEPRRLRRDLEKAFARWGKATGTLPEISAKARENGPRVLLVDKPGATQTYFWIGQVGALLGDPATEAQDLVHTLFGGRFTSMLNTELRVKSGLTYGATARLDRRPQPGAAFHASFTHTDTTIKAIDLALDVQHRLHTQPIPDDQLESARRYILGQFAPDYQTSGQLAETFANLALYALPRSHVEGYGERIKAVSPESVAAARQVFPIDRHYAMVVIGDAASIADDIAKYGPVTRMAITDPGFAPARLTPAQGDTP